MKKKKRMVAEIERSRGKDDDDGDDLMKPFGALY